MSVTLAFVGGSPGGRPPAMSLLTAPGRVQHRSRPAVDAASAGRTRRHRYRAGHLAGILPSVLLAGIFICAPYAGTTTVPMDGSAPAAAQVGVTAGRLAAAATPQVGVVSATRPAAAAAVPAASAARTADNPVPFRISGTAVRALVAAWLLLIVVAVATIAYVARATGHRGVHRS